MSASTSVESMPPSDNLYMKGLPPGTTEESLLAMFSTLGTVVSCKVLPNPPGLEGVAALVRMGSVQEAQWILENSSQFATGLGTPSLVIRFATNAKGQGKATAASGACGAVVQPPKLHLAAPAAAAVAAGGQPPPTSRLYMKGLPGGITEDHLKSIMAAYGTVVSAKVLSPPAGVSDSAAIVQMSSISEAQWLVDNLNGNIPQGLNSAVDVKFKTEKGDAQFGAWLEAADGEMGDSASETIYVTGFPSGFTEENVRLTLSSYGTARTCKVFPAPFGEAGVAAVVSMASMDEAAFLVENLNGNIPHGMTTPVEVRYADKALLAFKAAGKGQGFVQPRQPGPSSPASQRPQQQQQPDLSGGGGSGGGFSPDNLYMKGLPEDTTEEMLTRVFGAYGTVVSCKVLSSPPGVTSAAALVRMATPQQAKWLVENVNGNMPQGLSSPIQIRFANSSSSSTSTSNAAAQAQAAAQQFAATAQFSSQLASVAAQAPQLSERPAGTPAADNLYVKGFPADATDEAVKAILAPYGSVIACRALPPPVGKFVAAALVRMRSPDEAQWLIDHLDGNIPQGQPQALEVRYAAQANAGGKAAGKGPDSNGGASRWAPY